MSGKKSSQGSERPSWDGGYLANFKNRFPAYIESGFIAMWGKGEHHAVFSQSGIWRAGSVFGNELEDVMSKRSTKSWGGNSAGDQVNYIMNTPAKWSISRSCLPSEQHRDNARQCCRVHRLARHRGQSHDKQHRLGWRWETLYNLRYILDSVSFSSTFFGDLWLLRNVVSVIFLLLFAERFCSIYYH